ncbi:class I SAM-dependent methyltransferase [Streptomyces sp. NPDC059740]|uniref:class I SAM-dependent methyltransferase n=1 Tax=Streptomyces sp. NPDC059740 TaxID=3346926 RepID=UPI003653B947
MTPAGTARGGTRTGGRLPAGDLAGPRGPALRGAAADEVAAAGPLDPCRAAWRADPYTEALRTGRGPLYLRRADGWLLPMEVERWCAEADEADRSLLGRCEGEVLDIGCGPGRLVVALADAGHPVLGVDVTPAAVRRTIDAGGRALCRSVFEPLPGEGRWRTALLVDGNVGIGGDPLTLLRRVAEVVDVRGRLLVEVSPVDVDERVRVRVADSRGRLGQPFPWARVGERALLRLAARSGWVRAERWRAGGRRFVALHRAGG